MPPCATIRPSWKRVAPHTAIFISIFLCGLYPTSSKSSNSKESMSVLAGLMRSSCV